MSNWNSYGNLALNGVNYESPEGFSDRAFDYVFPDPQQFATGTVLVAAGATVEFDQFVDQGSIFLWFATELPPPKPGALDPYGYEITVQIYIDEEQVFDDALNNIAGFGNQSSPLPMFPVRFVPPGSLVRLVITNASAHDYYNCQIVLRGLRRYPSAQGARP